MGFFAGSRGITCALLAVSSVMCVVIAAVAGWALNTSIDHAIVTIGSLGFSEGNVIEAFFLPLSLLSSMVGLASIMTGWYHVRVWRTDSLAAAVSIAMVAWLLSMLAAGVALKEIHVGAPRSKKLKATEAMAVLQPLLGFYNLVSLYSAELLNVKQGATPDTSSKEPQTIV